MVNTAKVDDDRLTGNVQAVKDRLPAGTKIAAVVKGNAYGHGLVRVGLVLDKNPYISMLVTASLDEAMQLILAGAKKQILILNRIPKDILETELPGCEEAAGRKLSAQLVFSAYSEKDIAAVGEIGERMAETFMVHVRLDFFAGLRGMSSEKFASFAAKPLPSQGVKLTGIYAHLYSSYLPDMGRTREHLMAYAAAFDTIDPEFRKQLTLHVHSSASAFRFPELTFDMVRIGALLYGISGTGDDENTPQVKGILSLEGRVLNTAVIDAESETNYTGRLPSSVKRVALLSFGDWDLPVFFMNNHAMVRIRNRLCEIVGTPCMDSCCADITQFPEIKTGDRVEIMGDTENLRFSDWIEACGLSYGNCQMLFAGMERMGQSWKDINR